MGTMILVTKFNYFELVNIKIIPTVSLYIIYYLLYNFNGSVEFHFTYNKISLVIS